MGSTHFLSSSPYSLYHLFLNHAKTLQNPNFSSNFLCSSSSRRNWGSNFDASESRRFVFEDEFGKRRKRRNWWSDDDDEDEEEDDDDDLEFGFWEESSNAIDWFWKILRAFGWMVPAVMVSSLLGTGSDSLIMALVLPLGQTALSLVMDKMWGGDPNSRPSSKPRPRPRPRPRSRSRYRPKRNPSHPRTTYGGYESWNASTKNSGRSSSNYGGWDELDEQVSSSNIFTEEQRQKVEVFQKGYSETGRLSRRISRDKPLFLRLLIAVFPFLGSWTRFLF